jgi:hypothetical protein
MPHIPSPQAAAPRVEAPPSAPPGLMPRLTPECKPPSRPISPRGNIGYAIALLFIGGIVGPPGAIVCLVVAFDVAVVPVLSLAPAYLRFAWALLNLPRLALAVARKRREAARDALLTAITITYLFGPPWGVRRSLPRGWGEFILGPEGVEDLKRAGLAEDQRKPGRWRAGVVALYLLGRAGYRPPYALPLNLTMESMVAPPTVEDSLLACKAYLAGVAAGGRKPDATQLRALPLRYRGALSAHPALDVKLDPFGALGVQLINEALLGRRPWPTGLRELPAVALATKGRDGRRIGRYVYRAHPVAWLEAASYALTALVEEAASKVQ